MSTAASEETGSLTREPSKDFTKSKKTSKFKKIFRGKTKNGGMGAVAGPMSNQSNGNTIHEKGFVPIQNNKPTKSASVMKTMDGIRKDGALNLTLSVTSENFAAENAAEAEATAQKKVELPSKPSALAGGDGIIRMDKYGFLLTDKSPDNHHTPLHNNDPDVRLHKWQQMLDRVPKSKSTISFSNTQSKVKYYTRRGLPDSMRSRAWTVLTGVDVIMARRQGEYEGMVKRAEEEFERCRVNVEDEVGKNERRQSDVSALGDASVSNAVLETIDRDIHRTFPKHYLFANNDFEEDEGGSTGHGSVEDSDEIDHDSDEDDYDRGDGDESLAENEMTDEIKMEKKKLFDDMIGKSLSATVCGGLHNLGSEENGNTNDSAKKSSETSTTDQSTTSGHSGSPEGHGAGQAALRRILRAYSVYDSEVGYCQGMNFIAAMFLTFLTEEESFWLLVIVMNEEPYKLRELFGEDMAGTHEVLYIAEKLLQQFLPKLSQHLEAESIHISMFVTQWLLTVYTSTFPFELVSRVWDSFLVEGWKVVYRVMLALMETASKDIMTYSFEQILNYFRDFPNTVNGAKIMNASLKIPLKRKHIQKHVTEWRRSNAEEQSKLSSGISNPFRRRDSQESNMSGTIGSGSKTSSTKRRFKRRNSRDIKVEDFSGQLLPIIGESKFAIMIHNILTPEECEEIIELAEGSGFQPAAICDAATKTVHRNCTRCIIDDHALAGNWFKRILHSLNDTPHEQKVKECPWMGHKHKEPLHAVSLNERLRVVKYSHGQFFTKHVDATFTRGSDAGGREGEKSTVSVHFYLNQGYKGGITRFHGGNRSFDVHTKMGSVMLFESTIPHEAAKVTKGEKYVVRTDIMYSSKNDLSEVAGTGFIQQL